MSQKQNDAPSFFTKSKLLGIGSLLCASLVISASVAHISDVCSGETVISASVNGISIGSLKSISDMENAYSRFYSTVNRVTDGTFTPSIKIEYDYVRTEAPMYITEDECYEALWAQVENNFCTAHMLYIDDQQAVAHLDRGTLDDIISSIESELLSALPEEYSGVEISSRIRIEEQLCLKSDVKSRDEIYELLNPIVKENITVSEDNSEIVVRSSSLDVASAASDNTDFTLDYNLLNNMVMTEVIPFETVYIDVDTMYIGTESVECAGENGLKSVTYELSYDANGNYIGQTAISESVITEPISRVIHVGTAVIPEAKPTGTFSWPCKQPRGVSSYYGWRDLYGRPDFHLGIDIPDAKGSDIWAADGGTVTFTGYTPSYGYNIIIEHSNGFSTLYAHLDSISVKEGDKVYPRQSIGTMGATGVAYGTHLHFEVRIDNQTVDPMKYLPAQ